MSGDGHAHQETQRYGHAKINWNARLRHPIIKCFPAEFGWCVGGQASLRLNALLQFRQVLPWQCLHKNKTERATISWRKSNRAQVGCINDWNILKRWTCLRDAGDNGATFVQLQLVTNLHRTLWSVLVRREWLHKLLVRAAGLNKNRVGLAQVLQLALEHGGGRANQCCVIHANDIANLPATVWQLGHKQTFKQRTGPLNSSDTAHAVKRGHLHGLGVIHKLHRWIGHPQIGLRSFLYQRVGAAH